MKGRVTEKRFGKWGVVPKDVVSKYAELLGVAAKIPDVSGFLTDAFTPMANDFDEGKLINFAKSNKVK